MKYIWITATVFVIALVAWNAESVFAAKLYVSVNGIDSATCGGKNTPCRSISRAIANASTDDKIIVGPGYYGNLNSDLNFDDPGDEAAEVGFGCRCMIKINKRLMIESQNGAGATVLNARGNDISVVQIEASGTVFGKKNKGFTLTRSEYLGLVVADGVVGVRVEGNLAEVHQAGFFIQGSGHVFTGNVATGSAGVGFLLHGSGSTLSNNSATANFDSGFFIRGTGHVLTGNLSSGNHYPGFFLQGSGHLLTGNSAIGNQFAGIVVDSSATTITKNNIFGNNFLTYQGALNCGLRNRSGTSLSLAKNFWGAATGPGTLATPQPDPADNVCDDPSYPGSSTTVPSFAIKAFKVKLKLLDELPTDVPAKFVDASAFEKQRGFRLSLYTVTGQLVALIFDSTQLALTKQSLPNGVYFTMKIYADGRREIVKVVVTK
jgi:parallel beta-helix repeat protein